MKAWKSIAVVITILSGCFCSGIINAEIFWVTDLAVKLQSLKFLRRKVFNVWEVTELAHRYDKSERCAPMCHVTLVVRRVRRPRLRARRAWTSEANGHACAYLLAVQVRERWRHGGQCCWRSSSRRNQSSKLFVSFVIVFTRQRHFVNKLLLTCEFVKSTE